MGRRRQNRRTIGSKENLRAHKERGGILPKEIILAKQMILAMQSIRTIRPKEKGEDKISRLPDDLIHRILSLTDAKDAVQTSLLSTRWRNVWKSLSHLNFNRCIFGRITDFSKFVCEYLFHRDHRSDLSVLNLTCFKGVIQRSLLCKIISYGASHNLQQLNISSKVCQLPPSVFTIQSLRQLSFKAHFHGSINLFLKSPLDLPALTTLFFNRVLFELSGNDGAVNFFSKLPNLKNLTLFNCKPLGLESFYINSPQLENLYIKFTRVTTPQGVFVISAPKLSSFKYKGYKPLLISANDLHCLDKVYLNIGMDWYKEKEKQIVCKEVVNMFHQLRDAKFVTVSLCTIGLLSWVFELLKDQPSPFRYLECLQVEDDCLWRYSNSTSSTNVLTYLCSSSPSSTLIDHIYVVIGDNTESSFSFSDSP